MALEQAMKRGSGQMGDRRLQGIETIIQRQQLKSAASVNGHGMDSEDCVSSTARMAASGLAKVNTDKMTVKSPIQDCACEKNKAMKTDAPHSANTK